MRIIFSFLSHHHITLPSHTKQTLDAFLANPHEFLAIGQAYFTPEGGVSVAFTQPLVHLLFFDAHFLSSSRKAKVEHIIAHEFFHLLSAAALTKKEAGFTNLHSKEYSLIDEGFTDLFAHTALLAEKGEQNKSPKPTGYGPEVAAARMLIKTTAQYLEQSEAETFRMFLQRYINADHKWFKKITTEVLGEKFAYKIAHMKSGLSLLRLLHSTETT